VICTGGDRVFYPSATDHIQLPPAHESCAQNFAGGRPRSNGARCPCAIMTLKRAQARGPTAQPGLRE